MDQIDDNTKLNSIYENYLVPVCLIKIRMMILSPHSSCTACCAVKSKGKFETAEYEIREKSGRFFAVAKSETGTHECWRVVSRKVAEAIGVTPAK